MPKKINTKVTRIEVIPVQKTSTRRKWSFGITRGKHARLTEQAKELGKVTAYTWQRYGSIQGVTKYKNDIFNEVKSAPEFQHIPKKLIESHVVRALRDISMHREACKVKVRKNIHNHKSFTQERKKELFTKLKYDKWTDEPYLRRQMRKHWGKGKTNKCDQINLAAGLYDFNQPDFIAIQSFNQGERIRIPFRGEIPTHKSSGKSGKQRYPEIKLI